MKDYGRESGQTLPPEVAALIPGYLRRRDEDIQSLESFIKSDDFKSIKALGHKLKGNGASFGFDRISELGKLLMQAADIRSPQEISKLVFELQLIVNEQKLQQNVSDKITKEGT